MNQLNFVGFLSPVIEIFWLYLFALKRQQMNVLRSGVHKIMF